MIEYKVGSQEHLTGTVRADVLLDSQTVAISLDKGATWLSAVWEGDPGFRRKVRSAAPVTFAAPPRRGSALARITDASESVIIELGDYKVTAL
jgi:hypothetical protein